MKRFILFFLLIPGLAHSQVTITDVCIIEDSEIIIYGTSNVTNYQCELYDLSNNQNIAIESQRVGNKVFLQDAIVTLSAKGFACDNKMMTKDFYKAIKGEKYPEILVEFHEFTLEDLITNLPIQKNVPTLMSVKLAGVKRKYTTKLQQLQAKNNQLLFAGELNVSMSEFGIDPPTAMMGMIKTSDKIKIVYNITFDFK